MIVLYHEFKCLTKKFFKQISGKHKLKNYKLVKENIREKHMPAFQVLNENLFEELIFEKKT